MNAESPRFPLFDSLRAIAALTVVGFHVAFFTGSLGGGGASHWYGQLNVGVTIFFLVSGFLLYRPFAQARFAGTRPPRLVPYAIRRALRIVPAYWLALIGIGLWLGIDAIFTPHGILTYFGFLEVYDQASIAGADGIGQIWTLCVEASFYLLLPLWALALRRIRFSGTRGFVLSEAAVLGAAYAAAVVWLLATTQTDAQGHVAFSSSLVVLPAYLDHFALGMGLAVASVALAGRAPALTRRPLIPWALALAAFGALGLASTVAGAGGELLRHELKGLVALGVLVPAIWVAPRSAVARLLAWPPLLWVGVVSYGLYLWHPAILRKMATAGWQDSLGTVGFGLVGLALSLVVAAASWYGLERWGLKLGRRLTGRPMTEPDGRPVPASPQPQSG
ncbi:MAG: hypothetical protein QOJ07_3130 [Thermoleophilaceae bacterium]|nr:hypothetical protein [Thermoleophilaceae bacterium]